MAVKMVFLAKLEPCCCEMENDNNQGCIDAIWRKFAESRQTDA